MPKLTMTDRAVASSKLVPGKTYFDKKTLGLVLRVGSRKRVWNFVYRNGDSPEWFPLGSYPAVSLRCSSPWARSRQTARPRNRRNRSSRRTTEATGRTGSWLHEPSRSRTSSRRSSPFRRVGTLGAGRTTPRRSNVTSCRPGDHCRSEKHHAHARPRAARHRRWEGPHRRRQPHPGPGQSHVHGRARTTA